MYVDQLAALAQIHLKASAEYHQVGYFLDLCGHRSDIKCVHFTCYFYISFTTKQAKLKLSWKNSS